MLFDIQARVSIPASSLAMLTESGSVSHGAVRDRGAYTVLARIQIPHFQPSNNILTLFCFLFWLVGWFFGPVDAREACFGSCVVAVVAVVAAVGQSRRQGSP